jgi:penicillin G amidase
MKRKIGFAVLATAGAACIYALLVHFHGLGNVLQLTAYSSGVLRNDLPREDTVMYANSNGFNAEVSVDTLGIPHINAMNDNSAAYALGYMHAKERYFQMELISNMVMGKLSDMVGSDGINSDKMWKSFNLHEQAVNFYEGLKKESPRLFSYLDAYEQGVNAYVTSEPSDCRDPMYSIWNYQPGKWKGYYAFFMQWYMSFNLTFYDDYIKRQELLEKMPLSVRNILYPDAADTIPFIIPSQVVSKKTVADTEGAGTVSIFSNGKINNYKERPFNKSLGSNNWVIGREKTKNREMYLCNDLHLFLGAPNIFFEAHLKAPGLDVYGFTIPGVPMVLTGHNDKVAWGITNGGWDVTEQYLLKINPSDKNSYWLDGKWVKMTVKDYQITVKGGDTENFSPRYSVFGPVVERDSIVYGLKWYPTQSIKSISSFWKLMHTEGWESFREALRDYDYPAQNFVYADIKGNMGMVCAGKMPVKPAGYSGGLLDGTIFAKDAFVSFDSLPQVYNPATGFLFSANQKPANDGRYYSARWNDDLFRPARIRQLLSAPQLGYEDMRKMQMDVFDLSATQIQQLVRKYTTEATISANWKAFLGWNGEVKGNDRLSVFYKKVREAAYNVSDGIAAQMGTKSAPSFEQLIDFFSRGDSVAHNGRKIYAKDCFLKMINLSDSLYSIVGGGMTANAPGYGAPLYDFTIPNISLLPFLETPLHGMGGNDNTISVNYEAHAVVRTIVRIDSTGIQSFMVNATGQSGRINNKNYWQQLDAWKQNNLHETGFSPKANGTMPLKYKIIFKK